MTDHFSARVTRENRKDASSYLRQDGYVQILIEKFADKIFVMSLVLLLLGKQSYLTFRNSAAFARACPSISGLIRKLVLKTTMPIFTTIETARYDGSILLARHPERGFFYNNGLYVDEDRDDILNLAAALSGLQTKVNKQYLTWKRGKSPTRYPRVIPRTCHSRISQT
jgi:hypothetical protein